MGNVVAILAERLAIANVIAEFGVVDPLFQMMSTQSAAANPASLACVVVAMKDCGAPLSVSRFLHFRLALRGLSFLPFPSRVLFAHSSPASTCRRAENPFASFCSMAGAKKVLAADMASPLNAIFATRVRAIFAAEFGLGLNDGK